MRTSLKNKNVLLGVTGSVAAYKAVDIVKGLKNRGASVNVVMTDASLNFITPLTMKLACEAEVYSGMFQNPLSHIELPKKSDLMIVAPATANTIGKFANGIADDLLSACFMAFRGPVVIAPAMNWRMYESVAFKRNLDSLKSQGVIEAPPVTGRLACGEEGKGKMANPDTIVEEAVAAMSARDLTGKKIVVTAGPTRENIDLVRFISNRSSGKMGFAVATAAKRRGADVVLISGPVHLPEPCGIKYVSVTTANEMHKAVMDELNGAFALVMAAAVADFEPVKISGTKLDKSTINEIKLKATPDILALAGAKAAGMKNKRPLIIGFAAEAGLKHDRARKKMVQKRADMIVLNDITDPNAGFEKDTNRICVMDKTKKSDYPLMSKEEAADIVLDHVIKGKA